jgi:LysR family transcriptional regulator, transcriptional activator of the cysJI operon
MGSRSNSPLSHTQLKTFSLVAELGSFTKAAEILRLTQPAVTQQIRALSDHFGTPLFEMVGRTPVLTEAGVLLAERAGSVLSTLSSIERDIKENAEAKQGTLELGATLTIGNYALMPLLAAFRTTHPGSTLNVSIGNTGRMVAAIKERRLTIALIEGAVDDASLDVRPYATDELVLVVPAHGHRLSSIPVVEPKDLVSETFIGREGGSGMRSFVERALRETGLEQNVFLSFASGEGVSRAVEAGLGIAILSRFIVERSVAQGLLRIVRIAGVDLRRDFQIVRLPERTPSPLGQKFIDMLLTTASNAEKNH